MSNPSVMQHLFSQVPNVSIPRSRFDRSHGLKTTFDAGFLIPVFVDEVLPGDTFSLNCTYFGRLATPLHPFMDNMFLDSFFFFVPYRLVWDNFKRFMGEQDNPADTTSYIIPSLTSPGGGYGELSLYDYFGLPTKVANFFHSTLPLRAYNLIWNEWFRDQNLQNSVVVRKTDSGDLVGDYNVLRRGKRHDYFTSCLPFPQKGPAISLPLGTSANVKTNATDLVTGAQPPILFRTAAGGVPTANASYGNSGAGTRALTEGNVGAFAGNTLYPTNLFADLSTATAATINQLRQAFQIQRIYERDARGGTRYTELIQAHFGVTSPDARLQRSEYLGGGSVPFNVNPIAQTSATGAVGTPQGNLAAMGTVAQSGNGFAKSFTEHGVVIGMVSIRADLNYQNGLERFWSRASRFDFYWPALAMIGEQTVLNREIFVQGTPTDNQAFGYQERYAEYRYKPSRVTGQFRSNATTPLDTWHLAQQFTVLPLLDGTFIQDNPPVDRVIAVPTEPHILLDIFFRLQCARPMPVYSVPGMIDHF